MNSQLREQRIRPEGFGASSELQLSRDAPVSTLHPPSLLDRIALRIGVALIVWGHRRSRPHPLRQGPTRAQAARRHTSRLARERFEREQERRWHLTAPPR